MANTATEVEVKKGAAPRTYNHNYGAQNAGRAYSEQQFKSGKLLLIATPLALVFAAGAAYLVVRGWLRNSDNADRR